MGEMLLWLGRGRKWLAFAFSRFYDAITDVACVPGSLGFAAGHATFQACTVSVRSHNNFVNRSAQSAGSGASSIRL
jgi:hypothetical protein